jgi:hypothetical protein
VISKNEAKATRSLHTSSPPNIAKPKNTALARGINTPIFTPDILWIRFICRKSLLEPGIMTLGRRGLKKRLSSGWRNYEKRENKPNSNIIVSFLAQSPENCFVFVLYVIN